MYDTDDITRPELITYEPAQNTRGNPALAARTAPVHIEATYRTPHEHHNPIEPHAIIADWRGDELTVYLSSQGVTRPQGLLAALFGVPRENVRAISHYTGGGFGCKGVGAWPHEIACVWAARQIGRPIKLVLMRAQMFAGVGHRGECEMQLEVGASSDGNLGYLAHRTRTQGHANAPSYFESAGFPARLMYPAPNFEMTHVGARNKIAPPTYMRAPGESPGMFALEYAMDEMASQLDLDPLEFRLRNYAETDPHSGLPWSSNHLKQCYERGAELIGWRARQQQPRRARGPLSHRLRHGVGDLSGQSAHGFGAVPHHRRWPRRRGLRGLRYRDGRLHRVSPGRRRHARFSALSRRL